MGLEGEALARQAEEDVGIDKVGHLVVVGVDIRLGQLREACPADLFGLAGHRIIPPPVAPPPRRDTYGLAAALSFPREENGSCRPCPRCENGASHRAVGSRAF
jgi:hypothetical protein